MAAALAAVALAGCLGTAAPPPASGASVDLASAARDGGAAAAPADLAGAPAPAGGDLAGAADLARGGTPYVYVGGYSATIGVYTLDPQSGALTPRSSTPYGGGPSFLAVDPAHAHLYAVDENNSRVGAFAVDAKSGALTALGDVASGGSGPAFVSVDGSGKWVLVANYTDGAVATFAIGGNGGLAAATQVTSAGKNAHMFITDGSDHFAFVPCLGSGYVAQYLFDAAAGKLSANSVATVAPEATPPPNNNAPGPRHLALHPGGQLAYLANESNSTLTVFALDGTKGQLTPLQTLSTLPPGASAAGNTAAEIVVHPNGKVVYVSNRGDDSIVAFALDGSGHASYAGSVKSGGATPRSFTVDPSGAWLLAANQGGNNVVVFRLDASGAATATGHSITFSMPSFVGVVPL
jgi:6-phosphogluconolactonase